MMPIYPLDGGQILRSLLWFVFGRANSLLAASIIGFIGVGLLVLVAIFLQSIWIGIMAAFILMNCWRGLMHARALARIARIPRRPGFACPSCRTAPPLGELWRCGKCGQQFDIFLLRWEPARIAARNSMSLIAWTAEPPRPLQSGPILKSFSSSFSSSSSNYGFRLRGRGGRRGIEINPPP